MNKSVKVISKDEARVLRSIKSGFARLEIVMSRQLEKYETKKQALQDARLRELRSKGLIEFL